MDPYESTFTIKEEVLSESDDTYVSESTFAREHEPQLPLSDLKPEDELSQNVESDCVDSVYNDNGNQRITYTQVDYEKLSKQCKVLLNKQDVEKHLQTKCRVDIPGLCIKEEDTDSNTIIDESNDSSSDEESDMINEKFCAVDLEHIIPNTVSRKRKKVHSTLEDKLDALSDVTFSESSSSSDTDSSWSPSESGMSTIHRKKRRKTKDFTEKDDDKGSCDDGSEKQDVKPNMDFYVPRKVTFPFTKVSKVRRPNIKDEYKGQVRKLLPKPKIMRYNNAPLDALSKCVVIVASVKDQEKTDVTTTVTHSGGGGGGVAAKKQQSTINTQEQSVKNATPVMNQWPTFPLNLLPQKVLPKNIKSNDTILTNNQPRLSIPQNNQPRLTVSQNNQPRLTVSQNKQPRLISQNNQPRLISQNNQPRLISQKNQPITMILQNNQQMAMTPQMNQPRRTIIQTIQPRAMIHHDQNLTDPNAVIPNNQPIGTIDPTKTTPNILRLPIAPQNILPQNILPQNILAQNVIYIPQSATPGTLTVNPTAGNPSAANPTAGNPTAVNPTAGNPTAVNPTAVNLTTVNPTVSSQQQPVNIIFQSRPGQNVVGDNVRVLPQNMVLNYQRLATPVNIGVNNEANQNVLFQNSSGAQNIVLRNVAPWTVGNALNSVSDGVTPENVTPNSVTLHTVTSSNGTQSNVSSGISVPHIPSPNIAVYPPNIPLIATFQNPCQPRMPAQNIDLRKISPLTLGNALNSVNRGVTPENLTPNSVTLHNVSSYSVAPCNVTPSNIIQNDVSMGNVSILNGAAGNVTPSLASTQSVPQGTVTPQSVTPTFRISSPHIPSSNIVIPPPNIPQVATFQNPCRPRMPAPTTLVPATKVKSSGANQYTIYPHCLAQPNVVHRGAVAKAIFPGGILTKVPNTNTTPQAVSTPVTSTHFQMDVPQSIACQQRATFTETKPETRVTKPRNIKPKPTQTKDTVKVVSIPWKPPTHKSSRKTLEKKNTQTRQCKLSEPRMYQMPWKNPSARSVCLWKKYVKTHRYKELRKCVACQKEVNDRITPRRIAALDESYNLFKKAGLLNESQYYMADLILPYICASCTTQVKMFEIYRERYLKYYMNLINMKTSLLTVFGHDASQSNGFEANIMKLDIESSKPDAESSLENTDFEGAAKYFSEKKQERLKQKYGLKTSQLIRKKYLKNINHRCIDHKLNKNQAKQNGINETSEGSDRPKEFHKSLDDECKVVKLKKIKMKPRRLPRPIHKRACSDTSSVLKDLVDRANMKASVQSNQSPHPLAKLVEATSSILKDSESSFETPFTKKLSNIAPPIITIPSPTTVPETDSPVGTGISTLLPSVIGKESGSSKPHFTKKLSNIAPPISTIPSPITVPGTDSPVSTEISTLLPSSVIGTDIIGPPVNIPLAPISPMSDHDTTEPPPVLKPSKPIKSTPAVLKPSKPIKSTPAVLKPSKPIKSTQRAPRPSSRVISEEERVINEMYKQKSHSKTVRMKLIEKRSAAKMAHFSSSVIPPPRILERDGSMKLPIVIAASSPILEAPHTMTSSPGSSMLSLDRSAPISLPASGNHRTPSLQTESVRTSVHDTATTVQDKHIAKDEVIIIDEHSDEETITDMTDDSLTSDEEDVHSTPNNNARIKSLKLREKWRSDFLSAHTRSILSAQVKKSKFLCSSEELVSVRGDGSVAKNDPKLVSSLLLEKPLKISPISAQASVSQEINSNEAVQSGTDSSGTVKSKINPSDTVQSGIDSSGSVHPIIDSDSNGTKQSEIDSSKMVQSKPDAGEIRQLKIDSGRTVQPGIALGESVQLRIDSGENEQPEMTNVQQEIQSNGSSQSEIELIGQEQSRSNPIEPQDQMAFVIGGECYKVVQVIPDSDCADQQMPKTMNSEPIQNNLQPEKSNLQSGISSTQPGVNITDVQSGTENEKILNMPEYSIQINNEQAEKTVTIQSGVTVARADQLEAVDDNSLLLQGTQLLPQPVSTQNDVDISLASLNTVSSLGVNASSSSPAPFSILVPSSVEESEHAQDTSNMHIAEPWIERRVVNGPGRGTMINLAKNDNDVTVGYLEPAFIPNSKTNLKKPGPKSKMLKIKTRKPARAASTPSQSKNPPKIFPKPISKPPEDPPVINIDD